jgi:hypothetical protein
LLSAYKRAFLGAEPRFELGLAVHGTRKFFGGKEENF